MSVSPDGYDELCGRGRLAARDHKTNEAIALFQQAISVRPDDPHAYEGLATAYIVAKDIDNAIANFTRVMLLKPRDAKAYVNLGALYNLKDEYKKAADLLRKALQRDNRSANAYYNLAIAEKHLGQVAMAVSSYRECIRLQPDMVDAHINLANCFVEQKQLKKAIEHYETALKLAPQSIKAHRGLAHAKQLVEEHRQTDSPFGRLVDTSKLHGRDEVLAHARGLSDEERFQDHSFLQILAEKHAALVKGLARHLGEQMEHSLLNINRALLQDDNQTLALGSAREHFSTTLEFTKQLYDQLKSQGAELRQHESQLN